MKKLLFGSLVLFSTGICWGGATTISTSTVRGAPEYDIRNYGATANDNTNDRAAIHAAITAAANAGGGKVLVPQGNYKIGSTVYLPSNVTLQGMGIGVSTISALSGTLPQDASMIAVSSLLGVAYSTTTPGNNVTVRDLTIDCNGMPAASQNGVGMGIYVPMTNNFLAERVFISSSQSYGIGIEGLTNTFTMKNPRILNSYFRSCGVRGGQDTMGGGHHEGSIYQNNVCDNPQGTCIDNVYVKNALWTGNRSINTNTSSHAGSIWSDYGMVDSVVSNNNIENGSIHIYGYLTSQFRGPPINVRLIGNHIKNGGSSALYVSAGNQSGADLYVSSGIVVMGNTFDGCLDSCIVIQDSTGAVVMGNNINNWASGNFAVYMLGTSIGNRGATVMGNAGRKGASTIWYHEAVAGVTSSNDNALIGNNFPDCTISRSTQTPVSTVMEGTGGVINMKANGMTYAGEAGYVRINSSGNMMIDDAGNSAEVGLVVNKGTTTLVGGGPAAYVAAFYAPSTVMTDQAGIMLGYDRSGGGGGVIAARTQATGQPISFMTFNGSSWGTRMVIASTGQVRLNNYGAGTLTTDANGFVTATSDMRVKSIDSAFTRGLTDIFKLEPVNFHWKPGNGLDTVHSYTGFTAQNVLTAIPEAVGSDPQGLYTMADRPIMAAMVNAIKELNAKIARLENQLWRQQRKK